MSGSSSSRSTPVALQLECAEKEESFLETVFLCVAQFNFDKAREMAEKEREGSPRAGPQSSWAPVLSAVAHFAMAEKAYQSLLFLQPKGFLRKENTLKSSYESLRLDLRRIEDSGRSGAVERVLCSLAGQLGQLLAARIDLMELYEKMYTMGTGKQVVFEELLADIKDISEHYPAFHHPVLTSLNAAFGLECNILIQLLQAQVEIQQWRFLTSLMHLHEAHLKLTTWGSLLPSRETRKLGFSASYFMKPNQTSNLHQWLWKLKGALLSKFSLYFYEILSKQTTPAEMKLQCSKLPNDYVLKISSFHRKTDTAMVALVFDAHGVEDYKGHAGYHHPKKGSEPPKGLDSYPAVFCYPTRNITHWPNVVMMLTDRASELNALDRVVHFYDSRVQSTYFMFRCDARMTLVVIFDSRKSEKDSNIVNFMTDMCLQLRCTKVFASLKPGSK